MALSVLQVAVQRLLPVPGKACLFTFQARKSNWLLPKVLEVRVALSKYTFEFVCIFAAETRRKVQVIF